MDASYLEIKKLNPYDCEDSESYVNAYSPGCRGRWQREYLGRSVDELAALQDVELSAIARAIARTHGELIKLYTAKEKAEHVHATHEFGVVVKGSRTSTVESLSLRLSDKRWWRRKILKLADERREHLAQIAKELGATSGQVCCSDNTLKIMHERMVATRKFMASSFKIVTSTIGTSNPIYFSMEELDGKKKAARMNELFMDVKALEIIASAQGWRWAFVTLTAAPQYHSNPSVGKNSYDEKLSPRLANQAIAADWKAVRGFLKERDFKPGESYFGVRVTEVHDDGCPHWHVLIFFLPSMLDDLFDAVKEIYKHRGSYYYNNKDSIIKIGRTERSDGVASASSYIFKYLSFALSFNESDDVDMGVHNRYRCAIRAMGARQFQMFGVKRSRGKLRALAQVKGKSHLPENIKEMAEATFIQRAHGEADEEAENERRRKQLEARVSFFLGGAELLSYEHEEYTNQYGEQVKRVLAIKHSGDDEGVKIGGLCEDVNIQELKAIIRDASSMRS